MADRIPIFKNEPVTLTQVHPKTDIDPLAGIDPITGQPTNPAATEVFNNTASVYVNKWDILAVGSYYSTTNQSFAPCRQVYLRDIGLPILVSDSYATIKGYIDDRDCSDLCQVS